MKGSLKDQLDRAAQSILLNLAEGWGKPTMKDRKKFFAISFGSTREVQAILDLIEIKDESLLKLIDHVAACIYRLTYR